MKLLDQIACGAGLIGLGLFVYLFNPAFRGVSDLMILSGMFFPIIINHFRGGGFVNPKKFLCRGEDSITRKKRIDAIRSLEAQGIKVVDLD